jgi:HK97 family phage portal protein
MSIICDFFASGFRSEDDLLNDPAVWQDSGFNHSVPTSSGITVSPDKSLTLSAYWACVFNISSDLAKLPLDLIRNGTDGIRRKDSSSRLNRLLNVSPDGAISAYNFRQTIMQHVLAIGNGIAEIVRDGADNVSGLILIHPNRVRLERVDGQLIYWIRRDDNSSEELPFDSRDILHIRGLGTGDIGYSVLAYQSRLIGSSLQAEDFGSRMFGNGMLAGSILETNKPLNDKSIENLKAQLDRFRSRQEWHKTLILERDLKYKPLELPLADAKLLDEKKWTVEEIARWFRMPKSLIQSLENATLNNVETEGINYVRYTLSTWAENIEQEFRLKLFPESTSFEVRHDFKQFMRGDQKSRSDYYRGLSAIGAITPNEVRNDEQLNPIGTEGDKTYIQVNMQSLENASKAKTSQPQESSTIPNPGDNEENDEGEEQRFMLSKLNPVIEQVCSLLEKKEINTLSSIQKVDDLSSRESKRSKFYAQFNEKIVGTLSPVLESCGFSDHFSIARQFSESYCNKNSGKTNWALDNNSNLVVCEANSIKKLFVSFVEREFCNHD